MWGFYIICFLLILPFFYLVSFGPIRLPKTVVGFRAQDGVSAYSMKLTMRDRKTGAGVRSRREMLREPFTGFLHRFIISIDAQEEPIVTFSSASGFLSRVCNAQRAGSGSARIGIRRVLYIELKG